MSNESRKPGRPKLPPGEKKVAKSIKLHPDLWDAIDAEHGNRAKTIELWAEMDGLIPIKKEKNK